MRRLLRIRRLVSAAALAALVAVPVTAGATQVDVGGLNGGFTGGTDGWTSTASCAPLCSVTNGFDPAGASDPDRPRSSTRRSGACSADSRPARAPGRRRASPGRIRKPGSASLTLQRKAAIGGLLTLGGTANARVQLRDVTAGTITTLASEAISAADTSFGKHSLAIEPSLLEQGHSYRVVLTTNLAVAALLSGVRVSYDDVAITGVVADAGGGGTSTAGTSGGNGGANGSGPDPATPAGPAAALPMRPPLRASCASPWAGRWRSGSERRAGETRQATRRDPAHGRGNAALSTGRDGYASVKLTRRGRAPLRITFRAGTATATTWARVRA